MPSRKKDFASRSVVAFLAGFFLVSSVALGASQFMKTSVLDAGEVDEEDVEVEFVVDTSSEAALKEQLKEYQDRLQKSSKSVTGLKNLVRSLQVFERKGCSKSTCARAVKALDAAEDFGAADGDDVKAFKSRLKGLSKKGALADFNDEFSVLIGEAVENLKETLDAKQSEVLSAKEAVDTIRKALSELKPKKFIKEKPKKVLKKVEKEQRDEEVKKPLREDKDEALKSKRNLMNDKEKGDEDDVKTKRVLKKEKDEEPVKMKKTVREEEPVFKKPVKQPVREEEEEDDDSEFFDEAGGEDTSDSDAEDAGEEFAF